MKSLMSLWRALAIETASECCTSADLDIKTVKVRVRDEGDSFLTITLPEFAKGFERALETGQVDLSLFSSFKRQGRLPAFLRGFTDQIFDTDGTLLDDPSIPCIRSVRLLTRGFGKIRRPCSQEREYSAMQGFVQLEGELREFDHSSYEEYLPHFHKAVGLLWGDIFADVESVICGKRHLAYKYSDLALTGVLPVDDRVENRRTRRGVDPFMDLLKAPKQRFFTPPSGFVAGFGIDHNVEREVVDPSGWEHLVPRHGPGATADRLAGNGKFDLAEWTLRLESVFPYGDYGLAQLATVDELDRVKTLEPGSERPVKVVSVPKTLRTPRIIAVEPTCLQYMQQAVSQCLINRIEQGSELSPSWRQKGFEFGRAFVGFSDQEPNRLLAREGSLNGSLATLDLSEASDRVLNSHVMLLLSRNPRLLEAVQATRSTRANVPGFGVIPLAKFASMGSALCFPIEALVFTTIVFCGIAKARNVPITRGFFMDHVGKVRVYGDDIIVPVDCVQEVIRALEAFGLKVNTNKSFWNGKFRESCGGDYYDGEWVTPIYLRSDIPSTPRDSSNVVGLVAYRNLLYWGGYWKTASRIDEYLRSLFGEWYGEILDVTAAGVGRESVLAYQPVRFDPRTHVPLVRGLRIRARIPDSPVSGSGALLKFLIKRGSLPTQDERHLERQGRPRSLHIKRGWIRPY
nr:MAG: hypothetical protein 3 [Leviviridae sp.]